MIWVTILFSLFLIVLIGFADAGKLHSLLRLMNSFPYGDKIVHFFFIGVLSFLVIRTMMQLLPRQSPKWVSMIATFFLLAIFTLEEASQALIKGRDASISDLAANCAGIVTFTLLAYLTGKKVKDTLPAKSEE